MDLRLIEAAIRNAIEAGAQHAPPFNPLMGVEYDLNVVRAQTDIAMEPTTFGAYVAELSRDRELQLFNSTFATVPTGGGVSVSLQGIARLLLADAISSNDVTGTVERFRSYVEENSAPVIAVMGVSGVKSEREVRLGRDIRLLPMTSVPASVQRSAALGQEYFAFRGISGSDPSPIPSALISEFKYGPVFYRPSEGGVPSAQAWQLVKDVLSQLDEARSLLSLLGVAAVYRQAWFQPKYPLMTAGLGAGALINLEGVFGQDFEIDVTAAEELAAKYFAIERGRRHDTLRIPLDRLDRAARNRDLADTAIDLGIALEALLLHDLGNRGELRFRLSLRGAWLGGNDITERAEIQKALKDAYDLRSSAVHSGTVEPSEANWDKIRRGIKICRQLVRKTIDAKGRVEWGGLVLGGSASRE